MASRVVVGEEEEEDIVPTKPTVTPSTSQTQDKLDSSGSFVQGEEPEEETTQPVRTSLSHYSQSASSQQTPSKAPMEQTPQTPQQQQQQGSGESTPTDKSKPKQSLLEKKLSDRNEAFRKTIALKFWNVFQKTNRNLVQISLDLNTSLSKTQEISENLAELNENLLQLQLRVPTAVTWFDSFMVTKAK